MADTLTSPPALNGSATHPDIEMKDEPTAADVISPRKLRSGFKLTNDATPKTNPSSVPAAPTGRSTPVARSSPHPATQAPPSQPNPHGSPVRVYLNQKVTPWLLEGMKQVAIEEPEKPLKWLSEYLERKSREVEG